MLQELATSLERPGISLQNLQVFYKFLQKTANSCRIFQNESHTFATLKRLLFGLFAIILPNTCHFILHAPLQQNFTETNLCLSVQICFSYFLSLIKTVQTIFLGTKNSKKKLWYKNIFRLTSFCFEANFAIICVHLWITQISKNFSH